MGRSLAANLGECGEEHVVTMASCGWPEGHAGTRHAGLVETALVTWDEGEWATLPPAPMKPAVGCVGPYGKRFGGTNPPQVHVVDSAQEGLD